MTKHRGKVRRVRSDRGEISPDSFGSRFSMAPAAVELLLELIAASESPKKHPPKKHKQGNPKIIKPKAVPVDVQTSDPASNKPIKPMFLHEPSNTGKLLNFSEDYPDIRSVALGYLRKLGDCIGDANPDPEQYFEYRADGSIIVHNNPEALAVALGNRATEQANLIEPTIATNI